MLKLSGIIPSSSRVSKWSKLRPLSIALVTNWLLFHDEVFWLMPILGTTFLCPVCLAYRHLFLWLTFIEQISHNAPSTKNYINVMKASPRLQNKLAKNIENLKPKRRTCFPSVRPQYGSSWKYCIWKLLLRWGLKYIFSILFYYIHYLGGFVWQRFLLVFIERPTKKMIFLGKTCVQIVIHLF